MSLDTATETEAAAAPPKSETHRDVIVIGAGWSGLVSCKYMLEEGLSVVALEKRADIGGVWLYSDDPDVPTVMKSTQCTSSSTVTEMSDFPMPKEIGMFPHHSDVLEYLRAYAREFRLLPHIRLNSCVECAEKRDDGTWKVVATCERDRGVRKEEIYTSRYLVVASGEHQHPNKELEETVLSGFTGDVLHASQLKEPLEAYRGKRVLLLGGGETGSDICLDWIDHASCIYWSIPRGQHFFRKYSKVVPWGSPQALDKASSRMMKAIAPYHRSKPGLSWVCKWTTNGSLLAYQGHGISEWRNNSAFFHCFINKNGKVLDLVDYERLVPKGAVTGCRGKVVSFADGTSQEFDLVITSTGYKFDFPYLPRGQRQRGLRDRHKMVFDVEDPSLAFVGFVRPIVGSLVGISELQARWAAKLFAGRVALKSLEERRDDVSRDSAFWSDYFKDSSQRIQGLVEGFTYIDDIARQAGVYPDYWSLLRKSPKQWLVAVTSPYNGATFRLNEPQKVEQAIDTMRSHRKATLGPLQYLLILLLRFIWFDWWLERIGDVKYSIQTCRWWPAVRAWGVTRALNYLWTLPKRALFDNVSDDRNEMSLRARMLVNSSRPPDGAGGSGQACCSQLKDNQHSFSNGISKLVNGRVSMDGEHLRKRPQL